MFKRFVEKGVRFFLASIFALLLFSTPASALSVGSLEKISDDSDQIEILVPEAGYSFDVNFLAKNQELQYRATVTNDEEHPIKVESVALSASEYDFLEYSFDGIEAGDIIEVGQSKTLTMTVQTNSNNTSTVAEDYNLVLAYSQIKPAPEPEPNPDQENPETAVTTVVKTGTIALISIGAIAFVFIRNKRIRNYVVLFVATSLGIILLAPNTIAEEVSVFTIRGKVRFTNIYTVTVNPNGGIYGGKTENTVETRREGETYHVGEVSREHFELVEWEVNPGNLDENSDIEIHADTLIKAKWNENTYTLTIKPNGGTYNGSEEIYTESFRPNETATILTPEKEGYDFVDWTVEAGNIGEEGHFSDSSVTMVEDITLSANYTIKRLNVTIDPNGGTFNNSSEVYADTVDWGTEISLVNTAREGYRLTGWTWNETKTKSADTQSITITEDTALVANWEQIRYTLTISPNGGSYNGSTNVFSESYPVNTSVSISTPEKEGYNFDHWSVTEGNIGQDGVFTGDSATMTGNITLVAVYEIKTFTVTVIPNGGTYHGSMNTYTTTVNWNTDYVIESISREAHDLSDWTKTVGETSSSLNADTESVNIKADTTLEANWERNTFTLTIKPNGGKYEDSTDEWSHSYSVNTVATISTPEKEGYSFTNWTVEEGNIGTDGVFSGSSVTMTQDITLSANYSINSYTVTIDPNGGSYNNHTSSYSNAYDYDTEITMGEATRTHYTFAGWSMSVGELDSENKFKVTQDVTLTAQWTPINRTLTIDPNTGSYGNHTEEFSTEYFEGTEVSLSTPIKEHYHFSHWTLEDDSTYSESSVVMNEDIKLVANYEIDQVHVIVNPNGGTYLDSAEIYEADVDYGSEIDLTSIARENYDLKNWTKTTTEDVTLAADTESVTVTEDTTLVANWWSSIYYTVTIIPNGGTYDNSTEPSEYRVRSGEKYTMLEATREDKLFGYWRYTDSEDHMDESELTVTEDVSLTAEWVPIVARIERTQKLYPSIMAAHAEAQTDDIITLLVDTEEKVTNSKTVTLDLNTHTVTGYLINNGNLLLINGAFDNYQHNSGDENNVNGAAVINNGTLTLGIDDYENEDINAKAPIINHNYVRLFGNATGLEQRGTLNYYDGIIEGEVGLVGGYSKSPWFRYVDEVEEIKEVHYAPYVSRNNVKNQQHVQLESANLAVSKTIDNGEVYYYDLQDNVNASSVTGYDIYVVRDFPAQYAITVPEDTTINLDIVGYKVSASYPWENNGTLNITDSRKSYDTGYISFTGYSLTNNDELNLTDVKLTAGSNATIVQNKGDLTLVRSEISSTSSNSINLSGETANLTIDSNSLVKTTHGSYCAVTNDATEATINGGRIVGSYEAVCNHANKKLTLNNGTYAIESAKGDPAIVYNKGTLVMNNGTVTHDAENYSGTVRGICVDGGTTTIINSDISIRNKGGIKGIYSNNSSAVINFRSSSVVVENTSTGYSWDYASVGIHGNKNTYITKAEGSDRAPYIKVTSKDNQVFGVDNVNKVENATIEVSNVGGRDARGVADATVITDSTINVSGTNGSKYGISSVSTFNSGTVTVTGVGGEAYGIYAYGTTINGGTISASSESNNAYGCYFSGSNTGYINGGTISATTDNNEKLAYGAYAVNDYKLTITGGNISGKDFGAKAKKLTIGTLDDTLGKDAPIISGGDYGLDISEGYFYDGTLIGGTDYMLDKTKIVEVPEGTERHIETIDGKENAWLVKSEAYLFNNRLDPNDETAYYNSFSAAFADTRFQDGDTLQVTKDFTTESIHPKFTHPFTLDLNSHTLGYSNSLTGTSALTITDNSQAKTGKITHASTNKALIHDYDANLTISNVELVSNCKVVTKHGNTLTITDSTLRITSTSSNCENVVYLWGNSTATITRTTIAADTNTSTDARGMAFNDSTAIFYDSEINISTVSSEADGLYVGYYAWGNITLNNTNVNAISKSGNAYGARGYGDRGGGLTVAVRSGNVYAFSGTDASDPSTYAKTAYGLYVTNSATIGVQNGTSLENPSIKAIGKSSSGAEGWSGAFTVHNGKVEAIAKDDAYGVQDLSATMNNGVISAYSYTGNSYGVGRSSYGTYITLNNGSISATKADGNTNIATGTYANTTNIYGGTVYGDDYGIKGIGTSSNNKVTLGRDDGTLNKDALTVTGGSYGIYDGYVIFNDGTIIGKDAEGYDYISDRSLIKSIPAGSTYNIVKEDGKTKCWLVEASKFLRNSRLYAAHEAGSEDPDYVEDYEDYSSFKAAFEDSNLQDDDIIEVLEDNATEAVIPVNTHKITIDLKGHSVSNTQAIESSGNLTITDTSAGALGVLQNTNKDAYTINNTGTLKIEAGTVVGAGTAVHNAGTFNQNGGTIKAEGNDASRAIYNTAGKTTLTNATVLSTTDSTADETIYGIYIIGGSLEIIDSDIDVVSNGKRAYGIYDSYNYTPHSVTIKGNTTIDVLTHQTRNSYNYIINGGLIKTYTNANGAPSFTLTADHNGGTGIRTGSGSVIDSATITVTTTGDSVGIDGAGSVSNNTITVSGNTSKALYNPGTVTNNIISSTASDEALGIRTSVITAIVSGTTTVSSTGGNAYGYYFDGGNSHPGTIQGGTVTASTTGDGKIAYGVYTSSYVPLTVTGGTITGGDYGIYSFTDRDSDPLVIGVDDGVIYNGVDNSPANPVISGGQYGVYGGYVKFYDGRIRGNTAAHYDRNIKEIATDSYMHGTSETGYSDVKYVSVMEPLAKIGNGTCSVVDNVSCFPSLQSAITASQAEDKITLLKDNYVYGVINIPAGKDVTIELDGYNIIASAHIENNGKVTIQNTGSDVTLDYHEKDALFVNNDGGELTLKNLKFLVDTLAINKSGATLALDKTTVNYDNRSASSNYFIESAGTLNITNGSLLSSSENVIRQTAGKLSVVSSELKGNSDNTAYLINATGGEIELDAATLTDTSRYAYSIRSIEQENTTTIIKNGTTLENGRINVNSGSLSMNGSTYTATNWYEHFKISAGATVTIAGSTLNLAPCNSSNAGSIENAGNLTLVNSTLTTAVDQYSGYANKGIHNTGSVVLDKSTITVSIFGTRAGMDTSKYGIYNTGSDSSVYIRNGSNIIVKSDTTKAVYGVYIVNSATSEGGVYLEDSSTIDVSSPISYGVFLEGGKFVMGSREGTTEDTTNRTLPLVKAVSNSTASSAAGYGVYKYNNNGIFNFYDGKVVGSTHAIEGSVNETEYWCDVSEEQTDSDGNKYAVLRYLPGGNS